MNTVLDTIVAEAKTALGGNLLAVVLYGSHARGEGTEKSDFNLLLVVNDGSANALKPLTSLMPGWLKKRVTPPVILQQDQMPRSLDTFALEFLEMAAARTVLFGDDPFAAFTPDWTSVREELEREARQKRIALLRRWLAGATDEKRLRALIAETAPSFFTLLRCTLMLKSKTAQALTTDAVFTGLSSTPWFKIEVWSRLRAAAKSEAKLSRADLDTLIADYLQQVDALVKRLDELE